MNVYGVGGGLDMSKLMAPTSFSPGGRMPAGLDQQGVPSQIASITNDEGQNLIDIRGQLRDAVQGALQDFDGTGDPRGAVQDAIHSTLKENGFDPAEVQEAMQGGGFGPMPGMGRGSPMQSLMAGAGSPGFDSGFDPSTILSDGGDEDELIDSFLRQLRAGSNLDFEA